MRSGGADQAPSFILTLREHAIWWFGVIFKVNNDQQEVPEFAVTFETIRHFFYPPLARSTFHDLVNRGKIIPLKALRGYYLMNESRRRLGLNALLKIPTPESSVES